MGLFNLRKRAKSTASAATPVVVMRDLPSPRPVAPPPPPPTSAELRQKLFDAIASGDEARVSDLCREHRDFIHEYAEGWMIVPDSLRANPAAADWYTRGLQQLTRLCAG
jgi:hypothetical protein